MRLAAILAGSFSVVFSFQVRGQIATHGVCRSDVGSQWGIPVAVNGSLALVSDFSLTTGQNQNSAKSTAFQYTGGSWQTDASSSVLTNAKVIAMDGDLAVFGFPSTNHVTGFRRENGEWVQKAPYSPSGAGDSVGAAVDVSGNVVVVGAPGRNLGAGEVELFVFDDLGLHGPTHTIALPDAGGNRGHLYGSSVAISGDVLVVGEPEWNNGEGRIHVYVKGVSTWPTETPYVATGDNMGDRFGSAVAVDDTLIVVGAPYAGEGQVKVYKFNGTSLVPFSVLPPIVSGVSGPNTEARFGTTVAIYNDLVAVGAPGYWKSATTLARGAVGLFDATGGSVLREDAPGGANSRPFGTSLSLHERLMAVGNTRVTFCSQLGCTTNTCVRVFESPVLPPTPLSPANQVDMPFAVVLTWSDVPDANFYHVQLSDEDAFKSPLLDSRDATSGSLAVSDLEQSTSYFWRVRTLAGGPPLGWSSPWSTASAFSTRTLVPPSLVSPGDGISGTDTNVTLVWHAARFADSYVVQLGKDPGLGSVDVEQTVTAPDTTATVTNLEASTEYSWRVFTKTQNQSSEPSGIWRFRTAGASTLGQPSLTSPSDNATSVSLEPVFLWSAVPGQQISYVVQVSQTQSFSDGVLQAGPISGTSTTWSTSLDPSTRYFWRVRAESGGETGSWSGTFSFTTKGVTTPTLTAPTDGGIESGTQVTLRWEDVGATSYTVQVSPSSSFGSLFCHQDGITTTFFTLPNATSNCTAELEPHTAYYWRVESFAGSGSIGLTSAFSFSLYPSTISVSESVVFGQVDRTSSWRMLGIPGDADLSVGQTLTGTRGADWKVYDDPGGEEDGLVLDSGTFRFRPGKAYWVLSRNSWSVERDVPTLPLTSGGSVEIPLRSDWNMITSPFGYDVPWAAIKSANGLGSEALWAYSGNYADVAALQPFRGFYFKNVTGLTSLVVPVSVGKMISASTVENSAVTLRVMSSSSQLSSIASVAMLSDCRSGYDGVDRFAPPLHFETTDVRFLGPMDNGRRIELNRDCRNDGMAGERFVVLVSSETTEPLHLDAEIAEEYRGLRVELLDLQTGRTIDLSVAGITSEVLPGRYDLLIGTAAFVEQERSRSVPIATHLLPTYPNPASGAVTIELAVATTADYQLIVFDLLGRTIAKIVEGSLSSGFHTVYWNPKTADLGPLASGVYVLRLSGPGVVQDRRIVLLK